MSDNWRVVIGGLIPHKNTLPAPLLQSKHLSYLTKIALPSLELNFFSIFHSKPAFLRASSWVSLTMNEWELVGLTLLGKSLELTNGGSPNKLHTKERMREIFLKANLTSTLTWHQLAWVPNHKWPLNTLTSDLWRLSNHNEGNQRK